MKTKLFFTTGLVALFLAFCFSTETNAQDLKIGYVDADEVLRSMPEISNIQDQLEGFANRKRREFAQLETRFMQAQEEFEQKVAVISEQARQNEQERLAGMARELQEFQINYQNELLERQERLFGPLRQRIMEAIEEVSNEEGLTYVLNRVVNQADLVVLYASEEMQRRYDITEKVKGKLGI